MSDNIFVDREPLKAPFPWFGGKSRCAEEVWARFGVVDNYVEPFAGSLAVLLASPRVHRTETVNDADGFIANFWRAIASSPDKVAEYADWPVNENDQHARHAWLVNQRTELTARPEGDPDFYDPKIAGWWAWGIGTWIGSGWCSGNGPWASRGGKLVHLGNAGQGVHRQLVHLGDDANNGIFEWFSTLARRLRRVRVCCGDWGRVCGPTPTVKLGVTAVLLDPPYSEDERCMNLYAKDSGSVATDVRAWALENGTNRNLRIALCGYDSEHELPGWATYGWKARGGYASQGDGSNKNSTRETIWFSPHCLGSRQPSLFG